MSKQSPIERGSRWHDKHGTVRVMATAEGWVMFRYLGAMPGVQHEKDFLSRFTPGSFGEALSKALES